MSIYNIENAVFVRDVCKRNGIEVGLVSDGPALIRIMRNVGGKRAFVRWVEDNADEIKKVFDK